MRSQRTILIGAALIAALVIYLGYLNLSKNQALHVMELKVERLFRSTEQLTAQLQVVTEHRQRLEQALEDHKNKLQSVKEEAEKQRYNLKTTLDEANLRLHREALQRRQAEEAMEAARQEHERAYEELQKAKEDEVQRLAESLGAQRRWCKQLQEKLEERSRLQEAANVRPVPGAARVSGQESVPPVASNGRQMRHDRVVPNSAGSRQDVAQKDSAAADAPLMAAAEAVPAGGGGRLGQVMQVQQPAGFAAEQPLQSHGDVDGAGLQPAHAAAPHDGIRSDVRQGRPPALGGMNKHDQADGQSAGALMQLDLQAPAPPGPVDQPRQIAAQGKDSANAGGDFIPKDNNGHNRQRVHDADEADDDPRDHEAHNGDQLRDQLDGEADEDAVKVHPTLQIGHGPIFDSDN